MEVLASELAKILNITSDRAIQLYPVLKEQYINYKIISFIQTPCLAIAILTLIILGTLKILVLASGFVGDEIPPIVKRIFIVSTIILIISFIVYLTCNILTVKLAPDILLIKEFLNQ